MVAKIIVMGLGVVGLLITAFRPLGSSLFLYCCVIFLLVCAFFFFGSLVFFCGLLC
jgi:hypothetical protein